MSDHPDAEMHPERGLWGEDARRAGRELFAKYAPGTVFRREDDPDHGRKFLAAYASVWDDIEADPSVAENLRVRSDFMIGIGEQVTRRGWSQVEAARQLGVSESRVSDLFAGKIGKFTLDDLVAIGVKVGVRAVVETVHDKADVHRVAGRVADWSSELNRRLQ
ncbi:Uncharacterized conserved small protein (plasmid) [Tsukamurella tyrosinosolvens]|uniref:Predicted DNA-binding protein, contains XRE-type HTH domain n=1 Tax=Tsukamurella tyrosinosolvens TaxID=57704 RepID=A0A1H4QPK6_TSUTY|nr:XRE family transcriptional regulator [Tsukamurella tyrosinosolvens]SEC21471.1 Predicted DNA-binding protein, contains XRE-type HTH domain [Tsukamurella tyrosinosolvens]VEH92536.1 Uncharacterized conserved small protein [Tsukamurella tyrosinosolvens]